MYIAQSIKEQAGKCTVVDLAKGYSVYQGTMFRFARPTMIAQSPEYGDVRYITYTYSDGSSIKHVTWSRDRHEIGQMRVHTPMLWSRDRMRQSGAKGRKKMSDNRF
jgi:hypothetical protein